MSYSVDCPNANRSNTAQETNFGLLHWLNRAITLRQQRARLRQLDDAALRDVGLTRQDATKEAARSPWDAPQHWLK